KECGGYYEVECAAVPGQFGRVSDAKIRPREKLLSLFGRDRVYLYPMQVRLPHSPVNQGAEPASRPVTDLQTRVPCLRENAGPTKHCYGGAADRHVPEKPGRMPVRLKIRIYLPLPPSQFSQKALSFSGDL